MRFLLVKVYSSQNAVLKPGRIKPKNGMKKKIIPFDGWDFDKLSFRAKKKKREITGELVTYPKKMTYLHESQIKLQRKKDRLPVS